MRHQSIGDAEFCSHTNLKVKYPNDDTKLHMYSGFVKLCSHTNPLDRRPVWKSFRAIPLDTNRVKNRVYSKYASSTYLYILFVSVFVKWAHNLCGCADDKAGIVR
jgi:hypothetical protein